MSGRKRGHNFAVTINHVEWKKSCLGVYLEASELFKRFAIGEEAHNPPLDPDTGKVVEGDLGGYHHHIFLEFIEPYYLVEVREIFDDFFGGEAWSINIQVSGLSEICIKSLYIWYAHLHFRLANLLDIL